MKQTRSFIGMDVHKVTISISVAEDPGNDDRSAEDVLLAALSTTADEKLTGFALRITLSSHTAIPRKGEPDFLTEAEALFTLAPEPQNEGKPRLIKSTPKKAAAKKSTAKRKAA